MNPEPPRPPATSTTGPPSWMAPVQPVVPDHELIRRIGGGSYGDVWLARNVVGTWRAVKVVFRDRFLDARPYERELNGIQKFEPLSRSNEGFIDILQIGRNDEAGYFYYVMELADDANAEVGTRNAQRTQSPQDLIPHSALNAPHSYVPLTLSKALLQRGRLSVTECLELGLTLNLGLAHLHRAGLIHRDIKPSNIIFVGGVPKLADIGLVIETPEARSYVGTEGFIPPEGPTSPQADLYSLGKVLYEAGMGKDRKDFPEPFTQIASAPDSEQLLEFNAILLKACAANRADRYQSAEEMNADLALLQGGGSVRAQRTLARRLRLVRRAGAVAAAFAIMIAAGWLWQARQTEQMRQLAEEKARLADENRERVVQLNMANGFRQMDEGDFGSSILWFANVLKYATNDPAGVEMQRLRLSMLLRMHPRLLAILPTARPRTGADFFEVSEDGQRMLLDGPEGIELWQLSFPPERLVVVTNADRWPNRRLFRDGRRFVLSSRSGPGQQVWNVRSSNDVQVVELQAGVLKHVRPAADNRHILGVDTNNVMWVFDAETGLLVRKLDRFEQAPTAVHVTQNGRVGVEFDKQAMRILDFATGRSMGEADWGKAARHVAFDPHGRFLVTRPVEGISMVAQRKLRVWDLQAREPVGEPLVFRSGLRTGAASRNGRMLATASADLDEGIQVWDPFTGDRVAPPLRHAASISVIAFSPDSTRLASGDLDGVVKVWDLPSGREVTPPLHHQGHIQGLEFALGGAVLVVAAGDGDIRLWDLASPEASGPTFGISSTIQRVGFSLNGRFLYAGCDRMTLIWRTDDWRLTASINHESGYDGPVVFSPDTRQVAVGDRRLMVRVWDPETGEAAGPPLSHGTGEVLDLDFSNDGRILATGGDDGKVRLWDWRRGVELGSALQHTGSVEVVSFSARGDRLISATLIDGDLKSARYQAWLWDLDRRQVITQPAPVPKRFGLRAPKFSPDGSRWLAPGIAAVQVMDAASGHSVGARIKHDNTMTAAIFSADSRHVLTTSFDMTAALWDAAAGAQTSPPMLHREVPTIIGASNDGSLLATRTSENSLYFWDMARGLPLVPPRAMMYRTAALHPNGRYLVLAMPNRRIAIHDLRVDLPAENLEDLARNVSCRTLTTDGIERTLSMLELRGSFEQSRAVQPQNFVLTPAQRIQWHERQISEFGHLDRLESSLFHLDRILELQPENSVARDLGVRLKAKRIPAREPGTPARLIDLTDYYTRSFDTLTDDELDDLPRGIQQLAGTEFDLRGLVMLRPNVKRLQLSSGERPRVGHIRVGQHCRRLHFLQGVLDGGTEDFESARVVIHYADGSQRTQPMIYGRHLRNWHRPSDAPPGVTDAVVAWVGKSETIARRGEQVRLYKATWENPTPDIEITHLEYLLGELYTRPFLVAITAE